MPTGLSAKTIQPRIPASFYSFTFNIRNLHPHHHYIIIIFMHFFSSQVVSFLFFSHSLVHGHMTNVYFHQRNEGKWTFMTTAELYFFFL